MEALVEALERRLDSVGVETQPEIAQRILELTQDKEAQVLDYGRVIKTDPSLTGRLLRLANSAFFAQRGSVTSLDRACVLLGVERLRAFALGFYLSRAAAGDAKGQHSREVWGQSVFRACLAGEIARQVLPSHHTEAFVVGLMLDAGLALMPRLVGDRYLDMYTDAATPTVLYRREFRELDYTHVDVAAAMVRRWKLPELLALPIRWHHIEPGETTKVDALSRLHRIAYYVGALDLDSRTALPSGMAPMPMIAAKVLGVDSEQLSKSVRTACGEYQATAQLFSGVSQQVEDLDSLAQRVHQQLATVIEETLVSTFATAGKTDGLRLVVGGFAVEIEPDGQGHATAYLTTSNGERLASHTFELRSADAARICNGLGLDAPTPAESMALEGYFRRVAA